MRKIVRMDVCMYVCLILFHAKTTEQICMKLYSNIIYRYFYPEPRERSLRNREANIVEYTLDVLLKFCTYVLLKRQILNIFLCLFIGIKALCNYLALLAGTNLIKNHSVISVIHILVSEVVTTILILEKLRR